MIDYNSKSQRTNGRWTKQQHQKFLLGLQLYGKNWKKIQEVIGTRNGSQIRSHAQKFFLKMKKTINPHDSEEISQERLESNDMMTVISKSSSDEKDSKSSYSYFFSQIIKASAEEEQFDFWNKFIDQKKELHNQDLSQTQEQSTPKIEPLALDLADIPPLIEELNNE